MELEALSTPLVRIGVKHEFTYKENVGCMVRITKWTGRDQVPHVQIRPQIVSLDADCCMEVEVRNPFPDKKLFLQRNDKIACVSVFSSPIKHGMYSRHESPEALETSEKRWFRVSSVVLHRKGREHRPVAAGWWSQLVVEVSFTAFSSCRLLLLLFQLLLLLLLTSI